ncbi:MAG: 8-oxo-dGTP diphosphatase [Patescibacteria group bacterium]|nr:8-oxo-dGTP diphosphatase [Patescibacteria group bacterium]
MKLATLCYIKKDGRTLMMHRVRRREVVNAKWNGLGGKVEEGETPAECLAREVYEESGLKIQNPKLKGLLTFPHGTGKSDAWHVFVFIVNQFTGHVRKPELAEDSLQWVENKKLLDLPLMEGDRIFMPYLDQPGFFMGKFVYAVDGELKEYEIKNHQ